ncbi:MAG: hypothetical protein GXO93_03110 [FCB group bacterium]|nr:hypothetical protein [FCB group bacterium]
MKQKVIYRFFFQTVIVVAFIIAISGCTSRYRLDLYVTSAETQKRVKVQQTSFVEKAVLGDPYAKIKIKRGEGNTAILTIGARWAKKEKKRQQAPIIFTFDEYWKARLFLQLPLNLKENKYRLKNKSLLHILGEYELKPKDKIFLSANGFYLIDSLSGKHLFITVNGEYKNDRGQKLKVNGKFKVKMSP